MACNSPQQPSRSPCWIGGWDTKAQPLNVPSAGRIWLVSFLPSCGGGVWSPLRTFFLSREKILAYCWLGPIPWHLAYMVELSSQIPTREWLRLLLWLELKLCLGFCEIQYCRLLILGPCLDEMISVTSSKYRTVLALFFLRVSSEIQLLEVFLLSLSHCFACSQLDHIGYL